MPHCIIEYSQNTEQKIPVSNIMEEVKVACIRSSLFSPEDVKVRAFACNHFVAAGEEEGFIHVTLKILSGRTAEQKKSLSSLVLDNLVGLNFPQTILSVEVCDIDKASYVKTKVSP
ncbi:5-carboxymethyl-2-hydroxymuconate Delta-isomerase [Marinomonas sp. C2222]|uniref:5-carboxymethyl-2-hydroxymuconate Delta-isomerase n=1 Tax=Marinomonas sargassi TaxID=2984494 RepID=A0ABT2YVE7_9GAMM|nr:5-carboxymethyl-2-hydroxymuconate Delta-isomerase [Marinomonas sargassi]MCV2403872.1 5-carboxymethyl-2-hydroxymuconate Delta-isomerase [Marinomonas sargassi]